ncbi:DUF4912 domain-containing protein [Archangium violaceum]|uniref:DUF4912 domain-containing protein n=1 Tax=Archangium violaceum TaxID=83451 RepID=UPI00193C325E|nr:DUF4912 domain-containing protein [Archangium violaceum]QRK07667.1 DUF4912 domain-containing protein [Archangium violaceum]
MADLKSVTVEYLRELARKHLGRGHSKLKTKKDLLAALVKRVPGLAKLAGIQASETVKDGKAQKKAQRGARKVPVAVSAASRTENPEERPPKEPSAPASPLPGDDDEKTPVRHPPRPAEVVNFPPKPKQGRLSVDEEPTLTMPVETSEPSGPSAPPEPGHTVQHAAEPLVEGFFVARMAGEQEAWRHHLTESQRRGPRETLGSPDYDEQLGELPLDYGDDTALLLPRDPHTLFLLWDFSAAARQRALDGLESPRAVLRVYDDQDTLVKVLDVALESRSYYIHGLAPGRPYRVEAHFVGNGGRSRRIGHSSNRIFLPPAGPSSDTSVRFLRMPIVASRKDASMEKVAATAPTRNAPIEEREYITWRRVPLPGSGGFEDIPENRRERIGPGAPSEGAPGQDYLHVRRAEGSSEQWARPTGPAGSSEQWMRSAGPAGSSEQWMRSAGPAGSSEQWGWSAGSADASGQWMRSAGPAGSSEQWVWAAGPAGASGRWVRSAGPAGSSEQWVWAAGPAGSSEQWVWSAGPAGSSEQWAWSAGPAGSSEQWVWTYGPVGASEHGAGVRPTGASERWAWARPTSSGQGR